MAAFRSALASAAVAGATILRPGVCWKYDSGFWLWKAEPWTLPPEGPRTTIGTC